MTLTGPVCWGRTFQGPIQAVHVRPLIPKSTVTLDRGAGVK